MKIPEVIKIGAHKYKVLCHYPFKERGDLSGQHDTALLEIKISNKDSWSSLQKPDSRVLVTLLHEVIHAIDYSAGHPMKFLEGNEELVVESLSEGLCQVLLDNKGILKLFSNEEEEDV